MAKTKALISFAVTAKLICVFVFVYAKNRFSHDAAQIQWKRLLYGNNQLYLHDPSHWEVKVKGNPLLNHMKILIKTLLFSRPLTLKNERSLNSSMFSISHICENIFVLFVMSGMTSQEVWMFAPYKLVDQL